MRNDGYFKKFFVFMLLCLMVLSFASAQEQRFSIEVELFDNKTEPKVNATIIDSRQVTPFYGNGNYRFTLEDSEGNNISGGRMPVGFKAIGPIEGGGQSVRELESSKIYLFMKIINVTDTFNVYRQEEKIKEVDLKKRVCEKNPCNDFCSDVINQSELDSCESYDGFNQTDEKETTQGQEHKGLSNQVIVIIILALATIFTSAMYYRRRRNSKEE